MTTESLVFVLISTADTFFTLWLVGRGIAVEANPLMRFYLDLGAWAFVAVRLLMLCPVFMLEAAFDRNPRGIRNSLRAAILVYLFVYLTGTLVQFARLH